MSELSRVREEQVDQSRLHQTLAASFNEEELRTLCLHLKLDYEDLGGRGKEANARELVGRCARDRRLAALVEALLAARENLSLDAFICDTVSDESPYKGLFVFEEADRDIFFGRGVLTAELLARIQGADFLAVVGPSGSGKSSVVRAGLIPAVREQNGWLT